MAAGPFEEQSYNLLSKLPFKAVISTLPNVSYFCQSVRIPRISLSSTEVGFPTLNVPLPGQKLKFGQLVINYKVDEDLRNYSELFRRIVGTGFPQDPSQYQEYTGGKYEKTYFDLTIMSLTQKYNPNISFLFRNTWVADIGELDFSSELLDVEYMSAEAIFNFSYMEIKTITPPKS